MADLEVLLLKERLLARHRSITCITALAKTQPVNRFWSLNMNTTEMLRMSAHAMHPLPTPRASSTTGTATPTVTTHTAT